MATTWIEIADTAVKIGFGALAGGGATFMVEHWRRRSEQRLRDDELRRSRFVDPIVKFMDDVLAAIGELYWAHVDGREPRTTEWIAFFQQNQGAIEARVHALNDPHLRELWAPFTRKIIEVKVCLERRELADAHASMTEAFDQGGRILRRLFKWEM